MTRITIEGKDHEQIGKDLKHFFTVGQRKVVRHYKEKPEEIPTDCDVAIIEIKDKQEVTP